MTDSKHDLAIADVNTIAGLQRQIESLELRLSKLERGKAATSSDRDATKVHEPRKEAVCPTDSKDEDTTAGASPDNAIEGTSVSETVAEQVDEKPSRYVVQTRKWDEATGTFKEVDSVPKEEPPKIIGPQLENPRAFVFRKSITKSRFSFNETFSSEIKIEFKPLQELVGQITLKYGGEKLVTTLTSPFATLIYTWSEAIDESQDYIPGEPEDKRQAKIDLAEMLKLIETSSGFMGLNEYFKERDSFIGEQSITHAALWTLFPPGELIIAYPFSDEPQIFTVSHCSGFVTERDTFLRERDPPFVLTCFSFDWSGSEFGRVPFEMKVPLWGSDRRSIFELPFYPLKYYTDLSLRDMGSNEEAFARLRKKLVTRGKKFVNYCTAAKGKQMFRYKGDAHFHTGRSLLHTADDMNEPRSRQNDDASSYTGISRGRIALQTSRVDKKKIDSTAIVDFNSFYEYLSPNTPILGGYQRYDGPLESVSPEKRANPVFQDMYKFNWDNHGREKAMTDLQYMHCPPRVLGYALKQKKWAQLLVDGLKEPDEADASVFVHKLQLEDESKELVRCAVQAHERGKLPDKKGQLQGLQDFAPDKGKGLVIMLYGYPGVGKTLTAESVALMAGKPLLSVGVSDIGIEGDKVEANLQKVFDLAGKWEAVLLFDEADVFLEARDLGGIDLKRNAMVSVLLRVLEYYDGILILTTNRMKSFDIAVQSRVHIAIKYEELTVDQQITIFNSFLDQLIAKGLVDNPRDLKNWVNKDGKKMAFNGRQIRNVISTAMGIALIDDINGNKLCREHLVKVADQTREFKRDLRSQEELHKNLFK